MNFEVLLDDSVNFTRDTLLGERTRWIIMILLGLPGALLPLVLGINAMTAKTSIAWESVHWDQVAALLVLMFLASFFLSGYIVRIYRGVATPPPFDRWAGMFIDGIRLCIVWLIWMLPAIIVLELSLVSLFIAGLTGGPDSPNFALIGVILLQLLLAVILLLMAVIFGTLGAIRFARTGSVMEGVNYRGILDTIRQIGWWDYIIAGIILVVIALIFTIIISFLDLIPYIGWVLVLILTPVMSVLSARFLSLVYDAGMPPAPAA
jgi:hypothetical protein